MTDKIIIDSVDVSGCYYFERKRNNDKNFCRAFALPCDLEQEPCINCYYKQLQRTQNQYNAVVEQNKSLQQQFKRKEKECELLNTQLESYHIGEPKLVAENENLNKQLQAEKGNSKHLEDCLNQALKDFEEEQQRADKYKQALEEIKGIIKEEICVEECLYDWENNCPDSDCRYNQILQKCEVLND